MTKTDFVVISLIVALSLVALVPTLHQIGLTFDEPTYFDLSRSYMKWLSELKNSWLQGNFLEPFSQEKIDYYWRSTDAHPPLGKLLSGITHELFKNQVGEIAGFRLSAVLFFSVLLIFLYLFLLRVCNRTAAIFACLALTSMPRVWGHAHIAALDVPTSTLWVVFFYSFWRGTGNRTWSIVAGILFGLGLLTKITFAFALVPLLVWGMIFCRKSITSNIIAIGTISPLLFFLGWPWLWYDTWARLAAYLSFHLKHYPVPVLYLGTQFFQPPAPWHYPFVILLMSLPVVTLVLIFLGTSEILKSKAPSGLLLLFAGGLVPILLVAIPWIPKYDGERHFLAAHPFLAALAGIGFSRTAGWITRISLFQKKTWMGPMAVFLVGATLLMPQVWGILSYHPFELSYFNEIVGGLRGAHRLGMETTYWGDSCLPLLKRLNRLPLHSRIVFLSSNEDIAVEYQRNGNLRSDFYIVGNRVEDILRADYAALVCREGSFDEISRKLYEGQTPMYEERLQDVPLAQLYKISKISKTILAGIRPSATEGWLVYGPYIVVQPGKYEAVFTMKADAVGGRRVAKIDVVSKGGRQLASAEINGLDFFPAHVYRDFRLPFYSSGEKDVELRVFYYGSSGLLVDKITLIAKSQGNKSQVFEASDPRLGHQVGSATFDRSASAGDAWASWNIKY